MSQKACAAAAGVSQSSVARIEQGTRFYRSEAVTRVARAMGVGVDDILEPGQNASAVDRDAIVAEWLGLDPSAPGTAAALEDIKAVILSGR